MIRTMFSFNEAALLTEALHDAPPMWHTDDPAHLIADTVVTAISEDDLDIRWAVDRYQLQAILETLDKPTAAEILNRVAVYWRTYPHTSIVAGLLFAQLINPSKVEVKDTAHPFAQLISPSKAEVKDEPR